MVWRGSSDERNISLLDVLEYMRESPADVSSLDRSSAHGDESADATRYSTSHLFSGGKTMSYPYTDANVPLKCSECDEYLEGLQATMTHILVAHGNMYTMAEAKKYAEDWISLAHEEQEEQLADYYDDRKLDKAIHADTFPSK